jgi:hypothetical protein
MSLAETKPAPHKTIVDAMLILVRDGRILLAERQSTGYAQALNWKGEPYNAEPDKCSRIAWWPINRLPDSTYPYTAEGVRAYLHGEPFKNVGWKD